MNNHLFTYILYTFHDYSIWEKILILPPQWLNRYKPSSFTFNWSAEWMLHSRLHFNECDQLCSIYRSTYLYWIPKDQIRMNASNLHIHLRKKDRLKGHNFWYKEKFLKHNIHIEHMKYVLIVWRLISRMIICNKFEYFL